MSGEPDQPQAVFQIPDELINRWVHYPHDGEIAVAITRDDIDNLFFSIQGLVAANAELLTTLTLFSAGKTDEANEAYRKSSNAVLRADDRIRRFMASIMSKLPVTR